MVQIYKNKGGNMIHNIQVILLVILLKGGGAFAFLKYPLPNIYKTKERFRVEEHKNNSTEMQQTLSMKRI